MLITLGIRLTNDGGMVRNDVNRKLDPGLNASHVAYIPGERIPMGDTSDPKVRNQLEGLYEQGIRHHLVGRRPAAGAGARGGGRPAGA